MRLPVAGLCLQPAAFQTFGGVAFGRYPAHHHRRDLDAAFQTFGGVAFGALDASGSDICHCRGGCFVS